MKTKLVKDAKFKNGEVWEKNTEVLVKIEESQPMTALICKTDDPDNFKKCRSSKLHNWFDEFPKITDDDIQDAMMDSISPSLLGYTVEPDGWDCEGFPSILLACGLM